MVMRLLLSCVLVTAWAFVAPGETTAETRPSGRTDQVDLRPLFAQWNLPIKKQGSRNTCSVMTTVGAMEFALAKKLNTGTPLSAEYLNWACNRVIQNTTQDRGQFFHDLLKGYERFGICHEAEMPYAAQFRPDYSPTERATNAARAVQAHGLTAHWIKTHNRQPGVTDEHLEAVRATLRQGWPVCAGSFHSVLFVGYKNDASIEGGGGFYFRDSGNGKEGIMSYREAKSRLIDLVWYDTGGGSGPEAPEPTVPTGATPRRNAK